MNSSILKLTFLLTLSLAITSTANAEVKIEELFKDAIENLLTKKRDRGNQSATSQDNAIRVPVSRAEVQLSFAPLVAQVAPSVVNVYAARKASRQSPFAGDPFFERFFGGGNRRKRDQSSLGSGVIVSHSGVIITNHHVIKGADQVKVSLYDGREFEAEIILRDEQSDLAVLKVNSDEQFNPLELGDSEDAQVGDLVLAIGNPFGVGQTVTSGIISAVARSRQGISDFGFFLQTDAAINPGNSGGALVDMQGRLIGINTAIYSRSGGSNGIGFAIPSNMVEVVLASSETGDSVTRPWIGATFQEVTSEIAQSLGMSRPRGALVTNIVRGGPAQRAGIRAGDVILSVNGNRIPHVNALGYRLTTVGIGNRADFRILSRGKRKRVSLSLMAAPETVPRNETEMPRRSALGGSVLANLSPALAQEIRLPSGKTGVVVLGVKRNSFAAANGMRAGDIIREINDQAVETVREVKKQISRDGRRWIFVVERKGREYIFERKGGFFRQYSR